MKPMMNMKKQETLMPMMEWMLKCMPTRKCNLMPQTQTQAQTQTQIEDSNEFFKR